jgi:hypothetical protein
MEKNMAPICPLVKSRIIAPSRGGGEVISQFITYKEH